MKETACASFRLWYFNTVNTTTTTLAPIAPAPIAPATISIAFIDGAFYFQRQRGDAWRPFTPTFELVALHLCGPTDEEGCWEVEVEAFEKAFEKVMQARMGGAL
jgi:hypothetical protein